jgi:hypothetical protein
LRIQTKSEKRIREPFVDWKTDIGAERKEIPAAKAMLKTLFEIEVAAGALPRSPAPDYSSPQMRFRQLVEASLASVRAAIQKRLGPVISVDAPSRKRPHVQEQHGEEEVSDDVLKVSQVMRAAGVWEPVWKTYQPDLANRMLQIKCEATDGTFAARRLQQVAGTEVSVHAYRNPDDWPIAWRALGDTRSVYEKRLRELLEDAFVKADLYDQTIGRACAEAASRIAAQLNHIA